MLDGVNTSIRVATVADASMLAGFRFALRSSTGTAIETEEEFVERCKPWMEERLAEKSHWRCWIALRDLSAVGTLWGQMIEKIPNPSPKPEFLVYLSQFYVAEAVRGQGIGSLLLSAALTWCKERGVDEVILWPTERSRSLYLRYGFAVRDDLLELRISEET